MRRASRSILGGFFLLLVLAAPSRQALGQQEQEVHIRDLITRLGSEDWNERESATQELVDLGEKALPYLMEARQHEDPEIRIRAKRILMETGLWHQVPALVEEKVKELVKTLRGRDDLVHWHLQYNLEPYFYVWQLQDDLKILEDSRAAEFLLPALKDQDTMLRRNVAYLLGETGAEQAVGGLLEALGDEDEMVRCYAAFSLGKLGQVASAHAVCGLLQSDSEDVVTAALISLERIADRAAVSRMIELLEDPRPEIRFHAYYTVFRVTRCPINYNAYYRESKRAARARRLKEWWDANGDSVELRRPRREPEDS